MTKKSKIIEAWGELWDTVKDKVSESGWVNSDVVLCLYSPDTGLDKRFEQSAPDRSNLKPKYGVRPIALRGVENNNGWLSSGYHAGQEVRTNPFKDGKTYRLGFLNWNGNFISQGIKTYEGGFFENGYPMNPFPTHYQEIDPEQIKAPLYL
jgi:hypothetical protein